ncbi:MAG: NAD(P)H-dependent oxidoreductase [Proteobacteria bacterium]|nr:hypothetical protein [Desulfobacula sp.]MBU3952523.1 NAD(P)H-dependent oxidoreductase [Pseudomonadota bacterium]MBU4130475.1 NAD(P)H-dependent oxidoreductase [Pseudomonadota bacterium]
MKIVVINGSPKADQSITLQHIRYFMEKNPAHDLEIIPVAGPIARIEKTETLFREITEKMAGADAVIWSFPVYYALIPSQLKRFVELLFERCRPDLFKGKYTTSFTTSINFFDHTAHNYMQGVCEQLGFAYVKSYSAHMDDFFHEDKRKRMLGFYEWFIQMVEEKIPVARKYKIQVPKPIVYEPGSMDQFPVVSDKKVLLLTDAGPEDTNLNRMIDQFQRTCSMEVSLKNIHEIHMKQGCLGCCTCGYDNTCIQKDGFARFFNDNLKTADIIIIAGSVKDHYLSATWKKFFDRSFFNGHAPVLKGKRLGFIVSGPLSQIQNLRELLEGFGDGWHMKSAGFVTDEHKSSEDITTHIRAFAQELVLAEDRDLEFGARFYRVGGGKIFRDFVYTTSAVFMADHLFYKKMGMYRDFPQQKFKKRISNAVFLLFVKIRPMRKKIHQRFIPGMVAPYKKVLGKLSSHKS